MNSFDENAYYLLIWRAILVTLVGAILLLTHPVTLAAALLAAGVFALLFSLASTACAANLREDRIARSAAWRMIPLAKRPFGIGGRRWACNCLKEQMLKFASGAAAVAIILSASALMVGSE